MKIFPNIPSVIRLYGNLRFLNRYKNNIEQARASGDLEKERENIRLAEYEWANRLMDEFNCELVIHGEENMPKEGPVVYIANHQGYADIVAFCAALSKHMAFGYVAKSELEKVPAYGPWIKRIRSVLIKRDDPRESLKAIEEGITLIKQGFNMLIFPEGTRSKGPEMGSFKRGAFKLATKPGVPIVPVTILGSWRMYEETGVIKGTRIDVMVHPMVETAGIDRKAEKQLTADVENTIRNGLEKLMEIQEEANGEN